MKRIKNILNKIGQKFGDVKVDNSDLFYTDINITLTYWDIALIIVFVSFVVTAFCI